MTINKKEYRCFIGIPIAILGNLALLLQPKAENGSLTSYFLSSTFDVSSMFKQKSLLLTMTHLIMLVLFLFLYGNYFSSDLHGAGIYYLIRRKERRSWYLSHVWRLFLFTIFYQFCYLISLYLLCMYHTVSSPDRESLQVALSMLLSLTGVLFPVALITNIFGSALGDVLGGLIGFLVLAGMVLICLHQNDMILMQKHLWMRYLNPAYNMSLYYSGKNYVIIAFFIWSIEVFILLIFGEKLLSRLDIYGNQKETEG